MRRNVCFKEYKRISMCLPSSCNDMKPAAVTNLGHNEVKVVWDNGKIWKGSRHVLLMQAIDVVDDYYFYAMFTSGRWVNVAHVTHHELLDGGKRIEVHSSTQGDFTFIIDKLDGWSVSDVSKVNVG